jgi:hypothetical protein
MQSVGLGEPCGDGGREPLAAPAVPRLVPGQVPAIRPPVPHGLAAVGARPGERAEMGRPETPIGPPRTPTRPRRGWTHAPGPRRPGPGPRPSVPRTARPPAPAGCRRHTGPRCTLQDPGQHGCRAALRRLGCPKGAGTPCPLACPRGGCRVPQPGRVVRRQQPGRPLACSGQITTDGRHHRHAHAARSGTRTRLSGMKGGNRMPRQACQHPEALTWSRC